MGVLPDPTKLYFSELGLVPYGGALALQRALAELRARGEVGDLLLLLEHPPVITLGRHADPRHILASSEELARRGTEIWQVERGGQATYHGPGQLVGYLIFHLREAGFGVRQFVWTLEEAVLRTVAAWRVEAYRGDGAPGVWVDGAKLAAIGIRVKRGVGYHGFAVNLSPDLSAFRLIVPCGEPQGRVTSLAELLGEVPNPAQVQRALVRELAGLLGRSPLTVPAEALWELCPLSEGMDG